MRDALLFTATYGVTSKRFNNAALFDPAGGG